LSYTKFTPPPAPRKRWGEFDGYNTIMLSLKSFNADEDRINDLISDYDEMVDKETYTSKDEDCKLKGIVVRLFYDGIINHITNKYPHLDEYLPTYYFGVVVHEATHVKQICDIEKTLKESKDMEVEYSEADRRNDEERRNRINRISYKRNDGRRRRIKLIQKLHERFRYSNSNCEYEARDEEKKYIMSVVRNSCKDKEKIDDIEKRLDEIL
jgi:hypothetical protein